MNFIINESKQKLRGGYYTPLDLASFITAWVKEISPQKVLEPSCGDGVFFSAMSKVGGFDSSRTVGFELDEIEAAKASERASQCGLKNAKVNSADFLGYALENMIAGGEQFDAVVGNPPFVRYQYLPEKFQARAELIFDELGLKFTKHTNAWVPFILASISLLRPGGRLAMIVPSEILHVAHAQSLRSFLGRECKRLVILDPEELWFDGTIQGAVILMAEKVSNASSSRDGLGIVPVRGRSFLSRSPKEFFDLPETMNGKTVEGKWTRALLNHEARNLLETVASHDHVHRFKDIAKVDVGIVTGANKFFLVPDETVRNYRLQKWAHPMFGRSGHCPGIIYDDRQHSENTKNGNPTNFLWFNDEGPVDDSIRAYIELGESESLHTRYKCRIRTPWYKVPSVYSTEVGMLKRAHDTPRLILNKVGAYTTDTAYRISATGVEGKNLVGCFINPLTALTAELEGRHYGGGVLELVPSEIERLAIPIPQDVNINLDNLDASIRNEKADVFLERQGNVLLGALGLNKAQQSVLLEGWGLLRDRRQRISAEGAVDT